MLDLIFVLIVILFVKSWEITTWILIVFVIFQSLEHYHLVKRAQIAEENVKRLKEHLDNKSK